MKERTFLISIKKESITVTDTLNQRSLLSPIRKTLYNKLLFLLMFLGERIKKKEGCKR